MITNLVDKAYVTYIEDIDSNTMMCCFLLLPVQLKPEEYASPEKHNEETPACD